MLWIIFCVQAQSEVQFCSCKGTRVKGFSEQYGPTRYVLKDFKHVLVTCFAFSTVYQVFNYKLAVPHALIITTPLCWLLLRHTVITAYVNFDTQDLQFSVLDYMDYRGHKVGSRSTSLDRKVPVFGLSLKGSSSRWTAGGPWLHTDDCWVGQTPTQTRGYPLLI
jgi:hypothetical protein